MKIPDNMTEEEVIDIIDNISSVLAYKYKFGYHTVEDIKQQAFIHAISGLENYDGVRPLENFLFIHIRNRLYNDKRDNYERLNSPCLKCPIDAYKNKVCEEYNDKMECQWYSKWVKKNNARKNLIHAITFDNVDDEYENGMKNHYDFGHNLDTKDILDVVDRNIPIHMRADYLKLLGGVNISVDKKHTLIYIIREILKSNGISVDV